MNIYRREKLQVNAAKLIHGRNWQSLSSKYFKKGLTWKKKHLKSGKKQTNIKT